MTALSVPVLRWIHTETGLAAAMVDAEKRALDGQWSGASNGQIRAFFLRALAAAAMVGGEMPHADPSDANTLIVNVRPPARSDDKAFQDGLMRAIAGLILGADRKADSFAFTGERTAYTTGSDPGLATPVAAAFPWAAAAAVVGVAGVVATLIYGLVSQSNEVEFVKLQTDAKRAELATTLQTTVSVIEAHKKREADAGMSLPYDEQELRFLEALERNTSELTKWAPPPLTTVPPITKVGEKVGGAVAGAVEHVGEGAAIALPLVGLLAVFMLLR